MQAFSPMSPVSFPSSTMYFFLLLLCWSCSKVGEGVICGGRTQPRARVQHAAECSRGVVCGICSFLSA